MPELKSCPFCGRKAVYISVNEKQLIGYIRCTGFCCEQSLPLPKEEAVEAWNRREEDAPTVGAVEVVHARWIKDGDVVVCSNCGEEHGWDEYRATYCEDCGAKMDGGNEDA